MNLLKRLFTAKSEPWQITLARFCISKHTNGFDYEEVRKVAGGLGVSDGHFMNFWQEEIQTPAGRNFNRNDSKGIWMPPFDLVSKVTDYDELRDARRNALWAQIFAILSLIVASATLILQLYCS